jgi:hypothetical protein
MESIDQLNDDFPCDKRAGYGTKGCDCNGTKTVDTTRVKCLFYNKSVQFSQCRNCPHQKAYMRLLQSKK